MLMHFNSKSLNEPRVKIGFFEPPKKCQSEEGPALTEMRGEVERDPSPKKKKCQSEQEQRWGKHKSTKKVRVFFSW